MIDPKKLFGRLGNLMFQMAFLVSYAQEHTLDWYFQDPWFFQGHEEAIRQLFSSDIPEKTNRVAIHVRRGDYIDNPYYVDLMKTDYYQKAITLFPNEKFIVFSDDIDFCKRKWGVDDRFEFFHSDEITDMNKMASCKAHIIANSSFSWWGAWLSPHGGRVIAPSKEYWYSDGVERTICPIHWERI